MTVQNKEAFLLRCLIAALAVLLLWKSLGAAEQPPSPNGEPIFTFERLEYAERVGPGRALRVENLFGDIRMKKSAAEDIVECIAVIQNRQDSREPLYVDIQRSDGDVEFAVKPRSSSDGKAPSSPSGTPPSRVDLTVFVPKGVALEVITDKGLIGIKSLKCDVTARSEEGDITLRYVSGHQTVSSKSGEIMILLSDEASRDEQVFSTVTGDIAVYVREDADREVTVSTSGFITTDFSIDIRHHRSREPDKTGSVRIGRGGGPIKITSRRGHVRLVRLIRSLQDLQPSEKEATQ